MDEDKAILTLISTVLMHAMIVESKHSTTDQLVVKAVMLAQQLIDEIHDTVENGHV